MSTTSNFISDQIAKMKKEDFSEIENYYSAEYLQKAILSWQLIWPLKRPESEYENFNDNYDKFLLLIFDLIGKNVEAVGPQSTEILETKLIESMLSENKDSKITSIKDFVKPTRQIISTTIKEHANQYPDAKNFLEDILQALTYPKRLIAYLSEIDNSDDKIQQHLEFIVFFILRRKKYIQLSLIRGEKWD